MTQYKITAPSAGFKGEVAGVMFAQGQALLTTAPKPSPEDGATTLPKPNVALAYFRRKGYTVEEVTKPEDAELDTDTANPGTPASRAVNPAGLTGSGVTAPPGPDPVGSTELAAQSAAKAAADDGAGDDGDEPKLPAKSASKADWKAYAIERGMSEEDAEKATRDELAAKFHEEASK